MPLDMASAAPRARRAGTRASTTASRTALQQAERFDGLPEGMTRWHIAIALRGAAAALDLNPMMLRLLEYYIDLTWDADWTAGAEPIVTRPLVDIAAALGRSERQIRNIERALVERGLLAWRDSGNHRRSGRRDHRTGRLIYGYGPTLAPLAVRHREILAMAERCRREIETCRRLRIAISALRRRAAAYLAEAATIPQGRDQHDALRSRLAAIPPRCSARDNLAKLEDRYDALKALVEATEALLATGALTAETAGLAEIMQPRDSNTSNQKSMNGYVHRTSPSPHMARHGDTADMALALRCLTTDQRTMLRQNGPETPTNWHDIITMMHQRLCLLGIDQAQWAEACITMGRDRAALALIILEHGLERRDDRTIRQPRAYFGGLIARARREDLHLTRSLMAIARRTCAAGRSECGTPPRTSANRWPPPQTHTLRRTMS